MKMYAYKRGLSSVAALVANKIGVLYDSSKPKRNSLVCSWGSSSIPPWNNRVRWVNNPAATQLVANKANWAHFCSTAKTSPLSVGVPVSPWCLEYTTDIEQARAWAAIKNVKVVCRTILNGSCGKGIVIARNPKQVVKAPLYSLYFRKTSEYRVMYSPRVGPVFHWSKRKPEGKELNRDELLIRNIGSGYVYQEESPYDVPYRVIQACGQVSLPLDRLGLKILAYDVAYDSATDTAKVIEANTAAGLGDGAAEKLADALRQIEIDMNRERWV